MVGANCTLGGWSLNLTKQRLKLDIIPLSGVNCVLVGQSLNLTRQRPKSNTTLVSKSQLHMGTSVPKYLSPYSRTKIMIYPLTPGWDNDLSLYDRKIMTILPVRIIVNVNGGWIVLLMFGQRCLLDFMPEKRLLFVVGFFSTYYLISWNLVGVIPIRSWVNFLFNIEENMFV